MKTSTCTASQIRPTTLLLLLLAILSGCSAQHYKEDADKEVYQVIAHKRKAALDEEAPFSIEREPGDPLAGLPRKHQPLIDDPAAVESGLLPTDTEPPAIISLSRALETAVRNSRAYQDEKESVYLTALDLTMQRDNFSPTFTGLLSGAWTRDKPDESWSGDTQFGISKLLSTGGRVSLNLTTSFLRYVTGASRTQTTSVLAFELVQPLWRGAGQRIAQENLTQGERDAVYVLRSFARFHKTFAVSIVTRYYQVLQQRSLVRNEWNNYRRLVLGRERSEMLARAGRLPQFQVDQSKQDEFSARNRFVRSLQSYNDRLDSLKRLLSLPTEANLDVDENELSRLMSVGIIHPDISQETAIRRALDHRLDLLNTDDYVTDAQRKVEVAANGLGPDVDLTVTGNAATQDDTKPLRFRFDEGTYSAGLDVALPLERTSERNTYRKTLITLDRRRREAQDLRDAIKLQVREAWRTLQQAKISYGIQRNSLALAERRVDSTTMLLQAGRANTRDLLEAQRSLLEAQNSLTGTVIDHTIARLDLWRDIGTLTVSPNGEIKGNNP